MTAFYSEWDRYPAAWLRNLIAAGLLPDGVVDERSICDLTPDDVRGFRRQSYFAGIGGWDLGLRLAGVPDSAPIWTGSCPCQGLSVAGLLRGADDPRHLWPAWYRLIAECRPVFLCGEQAAGPLGRAWLAAVRHDLEDLGYAVWAADLAAASVSAPHIRQRHFFGAVLGVGLADTDSSGWLVEWRRGLLDRERAALGHDPDGCGQAGDGLADRTSSGRRQGPASSVRPGQRQGTGPANGSGLGVGVGVGHATRVAARPAQRSTRGAGADGHRMGEPIRHDAGRHPGASPGQEAEGDGQRGDPGRVGDLAGSPGAHGNPWADTVLVECRDPKRGVIYRPTPADPAIPVVAPRVPGDCPRLRAGGNAVVPPLVAAFVTSFLEAVTDTLL